MVDVASWFNTDNLKSWQKENASGKHWFKWIRAESSGHSVTEHWDSHIEY